jgi:hypothetical protein
MKELRTASFRRNPFGSGIELMCTDGLGNLYVLRYNDLYEIAQFLNQGLKFVSEDIKRTRDREKATQEVS